MLASAMRDSEPKQKPTHEVRLGRIRAAIWDNATDNGSWRKVTFSRLFKDKDNRWRDTESFSQEDVLLLTEVARQVAYILYKDEPEAATAEELVSRR
jgi:hypothetical protein